MGLLNLFKKKKYLYKIEFPFRAYEEDNPDNVISSTEIIKYMDSDDIDKIINSFEYSNLQQYFNEIGKKIKKMTLNLECSKYAQISIYTLCELTTIEKEQLLNLIKGQLSDGFGEDEFSIHISHKKYCLEFWNNQDWFIRYVDL